MMKKIFLKRNEASEYFQEKYDLPKTKLAVLVLITEPSGNKKLAWKISVKANAYYSFQRNEDKQLDINTNTIKIIDTSIKKNEIAFLFANDIYLFKRTYNADSELKRLVLNDWHICRPKELFFGTTIIEATLFEPQLFVVQNDIGENINMVWKANNIFYPVFRDDKVKNTKPTLLREIKLGEEFLLKKNVSLWVNAKEVKFDKYYLRTHKGKPCIGRIEL